MSVPPVVWAHRRYRPSPVHTHRGWWSEPPATIDLRAASGSKPERDTRGGFRVLLPTIFPIQQASDEVLTCPRRFVVIIHRRTGVNQRVRPEVKYSPRGAKTSGRSWASTR